jgi:serine phosphatase RsbU (regulator of sigma subunit)
MKSSLYRFACMEERVRRRDICVSLALLLLTFSASAQMFDLEQNRVQMMVLDGSWRFHTGDDPAWAQPSFDDSNWALLRSDETFSKQGYPDYTGFAWYRFPVRIPAGLRDPALILPNFGTSYQVFADGKLIGELGGMPPHRRSVWASYQLLRLPQAATASPRTIVIAIRGWNWIRGYGGPTGSSRLGSVAELSQWTSFLDLRNFWQNAASASLVLVYLMGGLGSLLLFAFRRSEREYLWFAIYELGTALQIVLNVMPTYGPAWSPGVYTAILISFTLNDFALIFFIGSMLRVGRPRALVVSGAAVVYIVLVYLWYPVLDAWMPAGFPPRAFGILETFEDVGQLTFNLGLLYTIYQAMRRKVSDAVLLFYPMLLFFLTMAILIARAAINNYGFHELSAQIDQLNQLTDWPFPIELLRVLEFLTQGGILAILVLRFARSRQDEERLSSEIEAARLVQQVLVPAETPVSPGFHIESLYKPAGEVGGDFFQIIAIPGGGALVVIGDVSGKGMPAAMTVSLLVGTLRTLAHYTQSPAEIMTAMNQRMLTRSQGGFTTCLILRVVPDGTVTAANAGHLAPYLDRQELNIDGGLPLGLDAQAVYAESTFELPEAAQLTLVTDGVVEARAKDGELFGFDRSRGLSSQSAQRIAEAAEAFGQEDDITVLTVVRQFVVHSS